MVILFDGVCNFCNSTINFLIDRDKKGIFKFAALQSDPGREILKKHNITTLTDFDSVILEKDGKLYQKSDAALEIARNMDGLWKLLYGFKILPRFIRDFVYDLVAKNRYRLMGKMDACRLPTPELRARFL
ncbi:thiol-disulfide oxidoreductase DCC family protein [Emticicia soli]|uniref:Thiol-disulfide oxidoreductase DCC family protein n=1 Tax=Emticicia soli TaxID=2027878 RepID=A0ABW5J2A4_9BACT